jgi:phenylpyruvate tautomerase PptA (4-oxalocrotonate tautomerase family)
MPLIHIKTTNLSTDQKKRIGDRIIDAFHNEGIPASSVVVLFSREEADILLDGGALFEINASRPELPAPKPLPPPPPPQPMTAGEPLPDFRSKLRRSKNELNSLKADLVKLLQQEQALSSFQAQEQLDLKACDWAPATLRRFFSELEEEGVIIKQGQKRGTRYVWKGINTQPANAVGSARLIKRSEDEGQA